MGDTSFSVKILNEPLGIGEKIARIGSMEGASFFRGAFLAITDDAIQLGCTDDVGGSHNLGSMPLQNISRIRLKTSVFTPGQQLIKPAMSGTFLGVGASVVAWFRVGGRPGTPIGDSPILSSLGLILFITVLFVVLNFGKIVWSHLAVIVFESDDGSTLQVSIENEKVEAIIAPLAERNIPVESL